jgi:alkylation response protein AidB-like acyl-CoA dehydrogenase
MPDDKNTCVIYLPGNGRAVDLRSHLSGIKSRFVASVITRPHFPRSTAVADYKAPLRDIRFVRNELLDFPGHYSRLRGGENATPDIVDAVIEEGARFCEEQVGPLRAVGDHEGCRLTDAGVVTPTGFREAYQRYVEGGWPSLSMPEQFGGQGLPASLDLTILEMSGAANFPWAMYPGLSAGARNTLMLHGSSEQQKIYLTKLVEGTWTGTMCLTEAHCGSDLGMLRSKAEPQADGSYRISGTKIFISSGDHDLAENIVHIVLARLPDAPAGTKGISLFIVPKFLPDASGEKGPRNGVSVGSLEEKMGIHGNATCVLNFDGATGYLIGEPNRGLHYMFTFMNTARIGTSMQGLGHAEVALQGALPYARERLQMRSLSGAKNPAGPADPIIVHPDVRRMLLTIKSFAEGNRAFLYYLAQFADLARDGDDAQRQHADDLLALLTPIAKGFMTETGLEAASLGVQIYGGHGYIREWGMEQNLRDARIATIYEGTTGIQAIDLLGRKVLGSGGKLLINFIGEINQYLAAQAENAALREFTAPLDQLAQEWGTLTASIGGRAMQNPDEAGAASFDYLMYSGYAVLAFFWTRMAEVALRKLAESGGVDDGFYSAKVKTARFYFHRILPRTAGHKGAIEAGADSLMALSAEEFGVL